MNVPSLTVLVFIFISLADRRVFPAAPCIYLTTYTSTNLTQHNGCVQGELTGLIGELHHDVMISYICPQTCQKVLNNPTSKQQKFRLPLTCASVSLITLR